MHERILKAILADAVDYARGKEKPIPDWSKEQLLFALDQCAINMAMLAKERNQPVPGEPYLVNRGDGVSGHYCIARDSLKGYTEYWYKEYWSSAGEVFDFSGGAHNDHDDPLPAWYSEYVTSWLQSNRLQEDQVRWGSFPLGMVWRWIERAELFERNCGKQPNEV